MEEDDGYCRHSYMMDVLFCVVPLFAPCLKIAPGVKISEQRSQNESRRNKIFLDGRRTVVQARARSHRAKSSARMHSFRIRWMVVVGSDLISAHCIRTKDQPEKDINNMSNESEAVAQLRRNDPNAKSVYIQLHDRA